MSSDTKTKQNTGIKIKEDFKIKVAEPKRFKIMILNNPVTPFFAVQDVLMTIFKKTEEEAMKIAIFTHNNGKGLVEAPVTQDIGDAKIDQAAAYCEQQEAMFGPETRYKLLKFKLEEDK